MRPRLRRLALPLALLVVTLGLAPFLAQVELASGFDVWLEAQGPGHEAYQRVLDSFGGGLEVVVAWEDREPLTPTHLARGRELARRARELPGVQEALALGGLLETLGLDAEDLDTEALEHPFLQGTFLGPHSAGFLVELREGARGQTVDALREVLGPDVHVAGAPVLNHALDVATREAPARSLPWMVGCTLAGLMVVAWRLRLARPTLFVLVPGMAGGFGVLVALAAMGATHTPLDLVTVAVPGFVWVVSLAAGVHAAFALQPGRVADGVRRAILWTGATTIFGLLSLSTAEVRSLREFGWFSSLGVAGGSVTAILLGTWLRQVAPPSTPGPHRPWGRGAWRWVVALLLVVLAAGVGTGALRLESRINPLDFLDRQDRTVLDYAWIQEHLTGLMPVLVLVEGSDDAARRESADEVGSALTDAGLASVAWSLGSLEELPDSDLSRRLRRRLDHSEASRSLIRLRGTRMEGEALGEIRALVRSQQLPEGITATVTGVVPLVIDLQDRLIEAQERSLSLVCVAVLVALVVITRSLRYGLAALVPNLIPAAVVLGAMGWVGRALDPATAMATAVAVGIAVDDTIHLLVHHGQARRQGLMGREATDHALRATLPAMTTTTFILILGFVTFLAVSFRPVRDFGLLIALAMASAWIADVLVLPVLLELVERRR